MCRHIDGMCWHIKIWPENNLSGVSSMCRHYGPMCRHFQHLSKKKFEWPKNKLSGSSSMCRHCGPMCQHFQHLDKKLFFNNNYPNSINLKHTYNIKNDQLARVMMIKYAWRDFKIRKPWYSKNIIFLKRNFNVKSNSLE